jgi:uncharacterized protein (TIGR02001 family)
LLALLACAAPAARAQSPSPVQAGLGVAAVSDVVVRGMSLSQKQPAPQLRVDLDGAGWYGGALVSRVHPAYRDAQAQWLAYGGYAARLPSGLSWEAGALRSTLGGSGYRYNELYAGLSGDRFAGRLYFSPSYYGDTATLYAELNGSTPLRDGLALLGHLGLLNPLGGTDDEARRRLDLRVGLSLDSGNWNFQLALLANLPRRQGADAPRSLQATVSYGF